MEKNSPKTIVILGPTASGKSDLAISLAQKYDGEIISADSRQVYRGMDIGSGKVTKAEQALAPHHLLDIADPKEDYNVTHFLRDAKKAHQEILERGKLPIIAGGTGFWVQTFIENQSFPGVKPNPELRERLGKKSLEELSAELSAKDPVRAKTIDKKNPLRLIRALEIIEVLGKVPEAGTPKIRNERYVILALDPERRTVLENIRLRLKKRFREGLVQEVERLNKEGVSWKRLESFGLEYKYIALFLQKKLKRAEMETLLLQEISRYAKRQMTWLRRMEAAGWDIHWIKNTESALEIIEKA
ncbi:MAG: tRNA (adenosine(37)-N6)-dimethylallyltransferase MiaA [Candidatus Moranbacteria bacterium RIFCSPHIGHO2_01_FULL_55_24]|nr:MAG: tRNA (adenosine(37)-N6)-dimethylallyltransferase MiaA [Candidatus Moranbacteria bacterium RIFCSPHIGHO2_01_FULL_55_24]